MLLVLVCAVTDFAEPMDTDRASQAVAGFALIQLPSGVATQLRVADPIRREQCTFQSSELAPRRGNPILPWIGSELRHDEGGCDRAGADRGDHAQDLRPMRLDEAYVDPAGDHRLQRGIGGRLTEAVEPAMLEIRDTRCELESQKGAEREDMVGITAAIGVMPPRRDLALIVEQRIQNVQRLACGCRDQFCEGRPLSVRHVRVDL